ncbi:MAG TPA: hypothetical protein VJ011_11315 [Steroidobacteraceae bacterium]|nr:hypothetical protein [Steroidobacteraceae bacterium]
MPHGREGRRLVTRTQTGVRIEQSVLAVLKSLATLKGMSLGDLLEGIVLHAFEGKLPFGADTLAQIADLKRVFRMELTAEDSHQLHEAETAPDEAASGRRTRTRRRHTQRGRA